MFATERSRLIKEILLDKKRIDVSSLSSMFDVSEVTIRRDLEKLERENFITRTHGGAILNEGDIEDFLDDTDDRDPITEKRLQIAEIAIQLINDNDVTVLTSGLTNICIAKKLSAKYNVTVFTNDLNIATEVLKNSTNHIILPGGDLNPNLLYLTGKLTEDNIRKFYVSKAFIEVDGVSLARGYTVQNIETASVLKELINISNQTIIICPSDAFDNIAFSQVAPISIANKIITNPTIPENYKSYFFENNIQLYTAFNSYEGNTI
jgi:DeoR/GlpR family transcriptional regulator of sugar metabolism